MDNPKSVVLAAGINQLIKSYEKKDKELCYKYIDDNFHEMPDLFDMLSDSVLIYIMKKNKHEIKRWALAKANGELK